MFICQSKANLDVNSLFGGITHLLDQKIRKMLVWGCLGTRFPSSILIHDLLAIENLIQYNRLFQK